MMVLDVDSELRVRLDQWPSCYGVTVNDPAGPESAGAARRRRAESLAP
jgi:hypothetical protein